MPPGSNAPASQPPSDVPGQPDMPAVQRVASALALTDVDAILRAIEARVERAKTVDEAVEAVRDARRGLADIRIEIEVEEILMAAAAAEEGDRDGDR